MVSRVALASAALPALVLAASSLGIDLDAHPEQRAAASVPWLALVLAALLLRNLRLAATTAVGFAIVALAPAAAQILLVILLAALFVSWLGLLRGFHSAAFVLSCLLVLGAMVKGHFLLHGTPREHRVLANAVRLTDRIYAAAIVLGPWVLPQHAMPWIVVFGAAGLVNWAVEDFCVSTALAEWMRTGTNVYVDREGNERLKTGARLGKRLGFGPSSPWPKRLFALVFALSISVAVVRYVYRIPSSAATRLSLTRP